MRQGDLFGGSDPVVTKVKWPVQPADATRRTGFTCWGWCKSCEPEVLSQNLAPVALRIYRLCSRIGSKCYPGSEVCEWADPPLPGPPVKPKTSSWDDY
jgi:hypothetical protein